MPLSGWLLYVNQHKLCQITFWPAIVALAKIQHWWYVIILIATKWLIVVCCFHLFCYWCWLSVYSLSMRCCCSWQDPTWECNEMMQYASHHIFISLSGWLLFVLFFCMLLYVVAYCCILLHVIVCCCMIDVVQNGFWQCMSMMQCMLLMMDVGCWNSGWCMLIMHVDVDVDVDDACRWWRRHVKYPMYFDANCVNYQLSRLGCCNEWWKTTMLVVALWYKRWTYNLYIVVIGSRRLIVV